MPGNAAQMPSGAEPDQPRKDAPALLRFFRQRTLLALLALGAIALGLALGLSEVSMVGDPRVVSEVRSEAVTLDVDGAVDLAERARLGTRPGDPDADGIAFDSVWIDTLSFAVSTRRFGLPEDVTGSGSHTERAGSPFVLQSLAATDRCLIHLERYAADVTRVGFTARGATSDVESPCRVRGRMLQPGGAPTDGGGGPGELILTEMWADSVVAGSASLYLQRRRPFGIYRVPVSGVRFEIQRGTAPIESAVLGGFLRFPDVGDRREDLFVGDTLTLGSLSGQAVEIVVADTLRTVYKGTASAPAIRPRPEESVRPSLLEQAQASREAKLWLAAFAGLFGVGLTIVDLFAELKS